MKRLLFVALAFVLLIFRSPVEGAALPPDVTKVVSFIFLADASGNLARDASNNPVPYGTGFFVGIKVGDGSQMSGYLVTAKHVLKDADGHDLKKIFVRMNAKTGDPQFAPLDLLQNSISIVHTHTDATVDLAVVPIVTRLLAQ